MSHIQVPQLSEQLEQLEAADFIYRTTIAAGAEYFFKHELTREVAYNSILIARRRMLHARALQVIEANFKMAWMRISTAWPSTLYSGELWEKAVPYQLGSARRAMSDGPTMR